MVRPSLHRFVALIVVACAGVMLAACSLAGEPEPAGPIETGPLPGEVSRLVPVEAPNVANGAQIFADRCSACHGIGGEGDGVDAARLADQGVTVPDFTSESFGREHTLQELYRVITVGNIERFMPPWEQSLSDAERWDAAAYVASVSVSEDMLAKGEKVYSSYCQTCHGADGSQNGLNDPAAMAVLSPQDVFDQYVTAGEDGAHKFGDTLDEDSRWAVTQYALTLSTLRDQPPVLTETEAPPEETPAATSQTPSAVGQVTGKVINGTSGAVVPDDIQVSLKGLSVEVDGSIVEFMNKSLPIEADGSFRFADLPFDRSQAAYFVTIVYNGVEYQNGNRIDPAIPSMDVPITIYETTTDPSVLSIAGHHLIVASGPDTLLINEILILNNSSDKVLVTEEPVAGGRRGGVEIPIPDDAFGLDFEDGELGGRFVQSGHTIYDTQQVLPGSQSHTISFSYILPFDASRDFTLQTVFPTSTINVIADEKLEVSSPLLSNMGPAPLAGPTFIRYAATDFEVGEPLNFRIATPVAWNEILRVGLSALMALLVIGSGALWVIRQRYGGTLTAVAANLDPSLVRLIADLDEAYERGEVNRFDYEYQRAELKAALAEKLQQPSSQSPQRRRKKKSK